MLEVPCIHLYTQPPIGPYATCISPSENMGVLVLTNLGVEVKSQFETTNIHLPGTFFMMRQIMVNR